MISPTCKHKIGEIKHPIKGLKWSITLTEFVELPIRVASPFPFSLTLERKRERGSRVLLEKGEKEEGRIRELA